MPIPFQHFPLILILLIACLAGCQSTPEQAGGQLPLPSKAPPPVPARQPMAVDASLLASSRAELTKASQSSSRSVRAHAIETLATSLGNAAYREIILGLSDPAPVVQFSAAMAAGDLKLTAAKAPLLRLVNDPDTRVRIAVRYGLHRLGDKRFSHFLEKTAVDPDPHIRAHTVVVLGKLGEPSALKILQTLKNDAQAPVRLQAAEAMWRLGDRSGLEDLVGGTLSAYPDDQMICIMALGSGGEPNIVQHVRTKLMSDYIEVKLTAARAMGLLGSDEGYTIAMDATRLKSPRLRAMAAFALAAIGRADSQGALEPLLRDADADVRLAAAGAVLQLK